MNKEELFNPNPLWGKSLVVCGDSFTEGDFTGWTDSEGRSLKDSPVIYDSEMGVYKTYPWWIAKRNNMRLYNRAKCGGVMALTKKYLESPETEDPNFAHPFSYKTYKNLGDDADYILIMYGLNDMFRCALGSIDDTTNETFYGAFNTVLEYLIERYPTTRIGTVVSNAYLSPDFAEAIRRVSVKWGIPYLDLMCDRGISATLSKAGMCDRARELRNRTYFVSEKNTHPNHIAHEHMSRPIEEFLRKL